MSLDTDYNNFGDKKIAFISKKSFGGSSAAVDKAIGRSLSPFSSNNNSSGGIEGQWQPVHPISFVRFVNCTSFEPHEFKIPVFSKEPGSSSNSIKITMKMEKRTFSLRGGAPDDDAARNAILLATYKAKEHGADWINIKCKFFTDKLQDKDIVVDFAPYSRTGVSVLHNNNAIGVLCCCTSLIICVEPKFETCTFGETDKRFMREVCAYNPALCRTTSVVAIYNEDSAFDDSKEKDMFKWELKESVIELVNIGWKNKLLSPTRNSIKAQAIKSAPKAPCKVFFGLQNFDVRSIPSKDDWEVPTQPESVVKEAEKAFFVECSKELLVEFEKAVVSIVEDLKTHNSSTRISESKEEEEEEEEDQTRNKRKCQTPEKSSGSSKKIKRSFADPQLDSSLSADEDEDDDDDDDDEAPKETSEEDEAAKETEEDDSQNDDDKIRYTNLPMAVNLQKKEFIAKMISSAFNLWFGSNSGWAQVLLCSGYALMASGLANSFMESLSAADLCATADWQEKLPMIAVKMVIEDAKMLNPQ